MGEVCGDQCREVSGYRSQLDTDRGPASAARQNAALREKQNADAGERSCRLMADIRRSAPRPTRDCMIRASAPRRFQRYAGSRPAWTMGAGCSEGHAFVRVRRRPDARRATRPRPAASARCPFHHLSGRGVRDPSRPRVLTVYELARSRHSPFLEGRRRTLGRPAAGHRVDLDAECPAPGAGPSLGRVTGRPAVLGLDDFAPLRTPIWVKNDSVPEVASSRWPAATFKQLHGLTTELPRVYSGILGIEKPPPRWARWTAVRARDRSRVPSTRSTRDARPTAHGSGNG